MRMSGDVRCKPRPGRTGASLALPDEKETPIPESCPVTRSTPETRFTPPPPQAASQSQRPGFLVRLGRALRLTCTADGRWRGIASPSGTRNKSFWYRKDAEWLMENPVPAQGDGEAHRCRRADDHVPPRQRTPSWVRRSRCCSCSSCPSVAAGR